MRTAAILLAAGRSIRMGTPKMLLPWEGRPLIRAMAQKFLAAGVDHILVVTGSQRAGVENALRGMRVKTVFNPRYEEEMAASVVAGFDALPPEIDFCFVLPADHPWLSPVTIVNLLDVAREHPDQFIFQPVHGGRGGHPLGLRLKPPGNPPVDLRAEILAAGSGWTLRDLLRKHQEQVVRWPCADPGCVRDLDFPDDLRG
jgi:molybdenum cofactor cytidylyltransferase